MFGLSRKTDYAVVALARLAEFQAEFQAESRADADAAVSARELAEADHLPLPLLSGLLKSLQRAGVVQSRRGVRGGYYLASDPGRIRLADVIRAVEGPEHVRLAVCCQPEPRADSDHDGDCGCRLIARCPISGAIRRLNDRLDRFLEQLTLQDLLA